MDWEAVFSHRAVAAAIAGALGAVGRDWRAFKMAPEPKDFKWVRFMKSAGMGALAGVASAYGLDVVI